MDKIPIEQKNWSFEDTFGENKNVDFELMMGAECLSEEEIKRKQFASKYYNMEITSGGLKTLMYEDIDLQLMMKVNKFIDLINENPNWHNQIETLLGKTLKEFLDVVLDKLKEMKNHEDYNLCKEIEKFFDRMRENIVFKGIYNLYEKANGITFEQCIKNKLTIFIDQINERSKKIKKVIKQQKAKKQRDNWINYKPKIETKKQEVDSINAFVILEKKRESDDENISEDRKRLREAIIRNQQRDEPGWDGPQLEEYYEQKAGICEITEGMKLMKQKFDNKVEVF